jgi:hypothetical protein
VAHGGRGQTTMGHGGCRYYSDRSQFSISRSGEYINFLNLKMTSNEKKFELKVVDLVESYKFRIKFISIRVHRKVTIF